MDNNTMRIQIHKSRILASGFRCADTDREYSVLWPKKYIYCEGKETVLNTGEFSREWCYAARKAIQIENSKIYKETGRFNWSSGDFVSMPSRYYTNTAERLAELFDDFIDNLAINNGTTDY